MSCQVLRPTTGGDCDLTLNESIKIKKTATMSTITWNDFEKVELRVGTIIKIEDFPEARKPAYKLTIDFGQYGTKKSSAQITDLYSADDLLGKQVVCVLNFEPKQIGPFVSEVLTTGFPDDQNRVVLVTPTHPVPNSMKLF